ncbi:hypothetical protein PR048_018426 [Dryococelus australis]|uniref:Uncharacterized protein n=1 Tax=Dryococelus australis TaxID=614101 RepID=A0ABQ9HCE4_9NEOP|nr:hypothetical protein PR048_018426 [Dryococelus australis]
MVLVSLLHLVYHVPRRGRHETGCGEQVRGGGGLAREAGSQRLSGPVCSPAEEQKVFPDLGQSAVNPALPLDPVAASAQTFRRQPLSQLRPPLTVDHHLYLQRPENFAGSFLDKLEFTHLIGIDPTIGLGRRRLRSRLWSRWSNFGACGAGRAIVEKVERLWSTCKVDCGADCGEDCGADFGVDCVVQYRRFWDTWRVAADMRILISILPESGCGHQDQSFSFSGNHLGIANICLPRTIGDQLRTSTVLAASTSLARALGIKASRTIGSHTGIGQSAHRCSDLEERALTVGNVFVFYDGRGKLFVLLLKHKDSTCVKNAIRREYQCDKSRRSYTKQEPHKDEYCTRTFKTSAVAVSHSSAAEDAIVDSIHNIYQAEEELVAKGSCRTLDSVHAIELRTSRATSRIHTCDICGAPFGDNLKRHTGMCKGTIPLLDTRSYGKSSLPADLTCTAISLHESAWCFKLDVENDTVTSKSVENNNVTSNYAGDDVPTTTKRKYVAEIYSMRKKNIDAIMYRKPSVKIDAKSDYSEYPNDLVDRLRWYLKATATILDQNFLLCQSGLPSWKSHCLAEWWLVLGGHVSGQCSANIYLQNDNRHLGTELPALSIRSITLEVAQSIVMADSGQRPCWQTVQRRQPFAQMVAASAVRSLNSGGHTSQPLYSRSVHDDEHGQWDQRMSACTLNGNQTYSLPTYIHRCFGTWLTSAWLVVLTDCLEFGTYIPQWLYGILAPATPLIVGDDNVMHLTAKMVAWQWGGFTMWTLADGGDLGMWRGRTRDKERKGQWSVLVVVPRMECTRKSVCVCGQAVAPRGQERQRWQCYTRSDRSRRLDDAPPPLPVRRWPPKWSRSLAGRQLS